jgi:hypothetical protein
MTFQPVSQQSVSALPPATWNNTCTQKACLPLYIKKSIESTQNQNIELSVWIVRKISINCCLFSKVALSLLNVF